MAVLPTWMKELETFTGTKMLHLSREARVTNIWGLYKGDYPVIIQYKKRIYLKLNNSGSYTDDISVYSTDIQNSLQTQVAVDEKTIRLTSENFMEIQEGLIINMLYDLPDAC